MVQGAHACAVGVRVCCGVRACPVRSPRRAPSAPQLVNGIPDESYWSMLAQHLGHRITGALTTYMEEGDAKTGHSRMFYEADLPRLWKQPAPAFFARKFPTTPKIDKAIEARIADARGLPAAPGAAAAAAPRPAAKGKGKGKGAGSRAKA